jgi:hypothetical protein
MADKIQLRRDTAANWTTANPTLAQGEIGVEIDNLGTNSPVKEKIGDGVTSWGDLPYKTADGGSVASVFGRAGTVTAQSGDYNTSQVTEGTNLYYTDSRVENNSAVQANTQKNSYPTADATKLSNIEASAQVNPTDTEIKTAYENNADTNAFTDAEKIKLSNQSGTNTGDQDISGIAANATAITGKISISTVASATEKGGLFFDYDSLNDIMTIDNQPL